MCTSQTHKVQRHGPDATMTAQPQQLLTLLPIMHLTVKSGGVGEKSKAVTSPAAEADNNQ